MHLQGIPEFELILDFKMLSTMEEKHAGEKKRKWTFNNEKEMEKLNNVKHSFYIQSR